MESLNDLVNLAVVTRGENGCALARNREIVEVRTEKVRVKNTTGAGDFFAARGFTVVSKKVELC